MNGIINWLLKKANKDSFLIDDRISKSYLLGFFFSKFIMMIRGLLSFTRNKGMLFIGRGVSLKYKQAMHFGRACSIDDDCLINALSVDGVVFGNNVSMGKRCVIECSGSLKHLGKGIKVSDNVGLGRDCFYGCAGGITIGSDTIIGNFVSMHSENHNVNDINVPIRLQGVNHKGITVGSDCWIGAKVTILDGAVIPDGCIIAAGCVVTEGKYEPYSIYGGVPARFIKKRN